MRFNTDHDSRPGNRAGRVLTVVLLVAALFVGTPAASARLFFFTADVALNGANIVPLDASLGLTPGITFYQTTIDGVEVTFATSNSQGFFANVFLGQDHFVTFFPDGVDIDFNPPVEAVGFQFRLAECQGAAEFDGAADSESFTTNFGDSNIFIGAADIGDISHVKLNGTCFAAAWLEMRFVPSTGSPPPTDEADVVLNKTGPNSASQANSPITFSLHVSNSGPDDANGTAVVDFLPAGVTPIASNPVFVILPGGFIITQQGVGVLGPGDDFTATLDVTLPPFNPSGIIDLLGIHIGIFNCNTALVNVGIATSSSLDFSDANNRSVFLTHFDNSSRFGFGEICDNAIDDNCNGIVDCSESNCRYTHPHCIPPPPIIPDYPFDPCDILFPPPPGVPCFGSPPNPDDRPNDGHVCHLSRGVCGGVTLPSYCCDASSFSDPSLENIRRLAENCAVGVPGCVPIDPNFKTASPGVNPAGYGYANAGETINYTLHYENVGAADAHDVLILDVLHPDLDDSTLVVNDGGTYDAANRLIEWIDPVLPPATPRSVSFSVAIRADAPPGTHVRNTATIIFPDADPPSRVETNFVDHLVPDPAFPIEPNLKVLRCLETSPGSNEWTVELSNHGWGYAYNVTATIINPPASIQVLSPTAAFAHPSDPDPDEFATVVPLAYTPSINTVSFITQTPDDPCDALTWRIEYETSDEQTLSVEKQCKPDADNDAVDDDDDNCPNTYNPTQSNDDGDTAGDECDDCPNDPNKTDPGVCGCDQPDVDSDNDTHLDCEDICLGFNDFADADNDSIPDGCDNCPNDANPNQEDDDNDGEGNACETPDAPAFVIDILPNREPNYVILSVPYTIYVAVLGSADFDTSTLEGPVTFGPTGAEASPIFGPLYLDINRDSYPDAIYFFLTPHCGFNLGDTEGLLTGWVGGVPVQAGDSVLVLP